jgi:hypothetical protein
VRDARRASARPIVITTQHAQTVVVLRQPTRRSSQSAATLPEAREMVEGFRAQTMEMVLVRLSGRRKPRPALRTAIAGWLGYMDATIIDWTQHGDLSHEKLRDLLIAAFGATLLAAQHIDPKVKIEHT